MPAGNGLRIISSFDVLKLIDMKWVMLSIAIGFLCFTGYAQHDKNHDWDENTRKIWIDSVLKTFDRKHLDEDI